MTRGNVGTIRRPPTKTKDEKMNNQPQKPDADEALLQDALANGRGEDQKRIAETVCRIGATLLRKNADYGGSAWQSPVLAPSMNAGDAIRVRMSDKINRLATLSTKSAEVSESVDDTLADLAGYCILELARPVEVEAEDDERARYPAWREDAQYNRGDIVKFGGFLFRAKKSVRLAEPSQAGAADVWEVVPSSHRSDEVEIGEDFTKYGYFDTAPAAADSVGDESVPFKRSREYSVVYGREAAAADSRVTSATLQTHDVELGRGMLSTPMLRAKATAYGYRATAVGEPARPVHYEPTLDTRTRCKNIKTHLPPSSKRRASEHALANRGDAADATAFAAMKAREELANQPPRAYGNDGYPPHGNHAIEEIEGLS